VADVVRTRARRWARRAGLAALALALAAAVAPLVAIQVVRARLDALEARIRGEIEAERHRPPEHLPVLRGLPREGDLIEEVARALREVAPVTSVTEQFVDDRLYQFAWEPRWTAQLEAERAPLAPGIAAIRSALACEAARAPYAEIPRVGYDDFLHEVDARWTTLGVPKDSLHAARKGFDLEVARAIAFGSAREAARVWADGCRFVHVVARLDDFCGRGIGRWWRPYSLEQLLIERLDEEGLREFEVELTRLEETVPVYADAVRRERLDFGRALIAARASGQIRDLTRWHSPRLSRSEEKLGWLTEEYRLWRGWERIDAELVSLEQSARPGPPWNEEGRVDAERSLEEAQPLEGCPVWVRTWWMPMNGNVQKCWLADLHLAELAKLKMLHAAIAAVRFHRARGRWPKTHEEALGRRPRPDELDPLTDEPFDVEPWVRSRLRADEDPLASQRDADAFYLGVELRGRRTPPRVAAHDPDGARVSLALTAASLGDAAAAITSQTETTVVVTNESDPITLSTPGASWVDGIGAVASAAQCDVVTLPCGTVVLDRQPHVTIQFAQADSRTTLMLLAAYAVKGIVFEKGFESRTIDVDIVDVDWRDALDRIARAAYCSARVEGTTIVAGPVGSGKFGASVSGLCSIPRVPHAEAVAATRPLVTLRGRDLVEAGLAGAERLLGVPLELDSQWGADRPDLRDVPWEDAVSAIALLSNGAIEQEDGVLRIVQTAVCAQDCPVGVLLPLLAHGHRKLDIAENVRDARVSFTQWPCSIDGADLRTVLWTLRQISIQEKDGEIRVTSRQAIPREDLPPVPVAGDDAWPSWRDFADERVAEVLGRAKISVAPDAVVAEIAAFTPRLPYVEALDRRLRLGTDSKRFRPRVARVRRVLELLAKASMMRGLHLWVEQETATAELSSIVGREPALRARIGHMIEWEVFARRLHERAGCLRLEATVVESPPVGSSCVISDRAYHVGDTIAPGLTLVRIGESVAKLALDGDEEWIELGGH
jgi:hypothetical protein